MNFHDAITDLAEALGKVDREAAFDWEGFHRMYREVLEEHLERFPAEERPAMIHHWEDWYRKALQRDAQGLPLDLKSLTDEELDAMEETCRRAVPSEAMRAHER